MEEIYQTYKEAESSKFLHVDVAAASMNCMLEKEDRKVAMERRQAKQLTVATILTFCSCSLGHLNRAGRANLNANKILFLIF